MAEEGEWSANANDALNIGLVRPTDAGLKAIATFNPRFTYPIFGNEEQIFGYKGLKINLRYSANDMRPHVQITSKEKFKAIGDTEPTDIRAVLQEHLPTIAFSSVKDFEASVQKTTKEWKPPGELHTSFETQDGTYEIRKGSLTDPAIHQLITRVEIFVPLFIEGGSYIARDPQAADPWKVPEDAARWTVFLLYRKQPVADDAAQSPYTFGKGIGARLYKSIFEHYLANPLAMELTVEDPNEAFDDMRDLSDLTYLKTVPEFAQVRINTDINVPDDSSKAVPRDIVDSDLLDKLRRKTKIAPRQFARLVEMHTMSQLPASVQPSFGVDKKAKPTRAEAHQYRLWRMFAKQRVYRQNKDILGQIDLPERREKLNEALGSVELEYARLLAAHERWEKHYGQNSSNGKRKSVDEAVGQGLSKKARVEDA
ncbi:Histone acetyltransferase type B catalytic subunit like protein [Verticillium longisporum]|uniref:Histone acetyltransferase type B catalytic subunit n=1 Tax=Verticillium longisporum TaxID=100787 RepID=A0A8I3AJX7_VERLO|nr:Histone acetyltransferase type B catalytic subunit like protein [Verticillium longisporum]